MSSPRLGSGDELVSACPFQIKVIVFSLPVSLPLGFCLLVG